MRISHIVRVSKEITLEIHIQAVVTVTKSRIRLMEIKTLQMLYEKHNTVSMNGIVDVQQKVQLKILLANYGKKRYRI